MNGFIFCLSFFVCASNANLDNITIDGLDIAFIEQPPSTFTLDAFFNAAFGTIDNKVWILGGEINQSSIVTTCNYTRFIDLETLEMTDANVSAPSPFTLVSDSNTQTDDAIYYTPSQSTTFYKFNATNLNYSMINSVPNGCGLSCLVSYQNPNDSVWYIYSLGGLNSSYSLLNSTHMYNTDSDSWITMTGELKIGRVQHSCAIADSNSITNEVRIYVFGGRTGINLTSNNTIEYCVVDIGGTNMINDDCIIITDVLNQNKQQMRTFAFNNHLILIVGGKLNDIDSTNEIEVLDINDNAVYHNSTMNIIEPLYGFVYTLDKTLGVLYIWGGETIASGVKPQVDAWKIGCVYNNENLVSLTPNQYIYDDTNYTCSDADIPTAVPSDHPSVSPTAVPSGHPSDPSNIPSDYPSPGTSDTISMVDGPTTSPTSMAPSTAPTISNANAKLVQTWNDTGTYVLFAFIVCGICVIIYVRYKWSKTKKISDKVNLVAVVRYILQVLDLWTDSSLCVVLYYQELYDLTIAAAIFVIIPYLMSVLVSIYSISKWTRWMQDHPSRLKRYLGKYKFVIILFSLFGGFYATIDLFRSKILYLEITYFPLKQSEYDQLKYFKFVNFILLESIPQFSIQLYYLTQYNNNQSSILPIVFVSLALTVISLLYGGIKITMSIIDEYINSPKQKFAYETNFNVIFILEVSDLNKIHAFCHSKMQQYIMSVLATCNDHTQWNGRSDVYFDVECYDIECKLYSNQLIIYFELKVFTMLKNHKNVIEKLSVNITAMLDGNVLSPNAIQLRKVEFGLFYSFFFSIVWFVG